MQLLRKWVQRNFALAVACGVAFVLLLGAGARIWLDNQQARAYLGEALLEKSEQEASQKRWSRAAAYAAAARVHDDTAEARWRAAQRGPVQIDSVWRTQLPTGIDAIAIAKNGAMIAAALGDHSIRLLDAKNIQHRRSNIINRWNDALCGVTLTPCLYRYGPRHHSVICCPVLARSNSSDIRTQRSRIPSASAIFAFSRSLAASADGEPAANGAA